jgi:hypothetical protein
MGVPGKFAAALISGFLDADRLAEFARPERAHEPNEKKV